MSPELQTTLLLFFVASTVLTGLYSFRKQSREKDKPLENYNASNKDETKQRSLSPMLSKSVETSPAASRSYNSIHLLAGWLGLGSLAGAAVAIQFGGPGALAWMWIASILATSLAFAENTLRQQSRPKQSSSHSNEGLSSNAFSYLRILPGFARFIWPVGFGLISLIFLLFVGGLWQSQQSAMVLEELFGIPPSHSVAWIGVAALLVLVTRKNFWYRKFSALIPWALIGYLGLLAWIILAQTEALPSVLDLVIRESWNWDAGLWGGLSSILPAAVYGLVFSVIGHEAGLGTQSFIHHTRLQDSTNSLVGKKTRRLFFLPLLTGGLISGLTGLALLSSDFPVYERIDHPLLRSTVRDSNRSQNESKKTNQDQAPSTSQATALAKLVPYESPHSSQFLPSDAGQLIVLPSNTPLKANMRYPMVFRGNPRGTKVGKLTPKGNGIITFGWKIFRSIDTVIFRDRDPKRNKISFYDLHIPVKQIRLGGRTTPSSIIFVPRDKNVDLRRLSEKMDGPYLLSDDYYFDAMVVETKLNRNDEEKKLSIIEDPDRLESANPSLQQVVSDLGYRGPYFANAHPQSDNAHPPWAFVSTPGFSAPVGSKIQLEMHSPKRGLAIGRLRIDGSLETPPWTFLREVSQVVYQHENDPSLDKKVSVTGVIRNGMLRFHSVDPEINSLEILSNQKPYTGPFLLAPQVEIPAEVRSGEPLPQSVLSLVGSDSSSKHAASTIRSLIPLQNSAPIERSNIKSAIAPNINDLIASGMEGPYIKHQGIGQVIGMLKAHLGVAAATIAGACVLFLAIFSLLSICSRGQSIAQELMGTGGEYGFRVCLAVAACLGATIEYSGVINALLSIISVLFVFHLSGLILSICGRKSLPS